MYPYIILAVYIIIVLSVLWFYVIFSIQIKDFRVYSRYITPVFRLLMLIIILITIFWAVMILTSDNNWTNINRSFDISSGTRMDY